MSRRLQLSAPTKPTYRVLIAAASMQLSLRQLVVASAALASAKAQIDIRSSVVDVSLHRRTSAGQTVAFSCYGGGGDCECPRDLNGDDGVLINVYPGYQCAYPNGACTWDDKVCHQISSCTRQHLSLSRFRAALFRIPTKQIARPVPLAARAEGAAAPTTRTEIAEYSSTSLRAISAPTQTVHAPGTS